MSIKRITKIQKVGGSLRTTIPVLVKELYDLDAGDSLEWEINLEENKIVVSKVK